MKNIYKLVKLNSLIRSHRLKFSSVLAAQYLGIRHLFVRLDPVMACNLSCTMCYFSNEDYRMHAKGIFSKEDIERIAALFYRRALQLVIGCGTEPTLYKNFPELVKIAKVYEIPYVGFTSNGQLLREQHIEEFIAYGLDELTLSVHGITKETYERFMAGASYETFHSVLHTIDSVKKRYRSPKPFLRLNYTVNEENLDELAGFFEVFGSYDIKTLQIRPVMDFRGEYRKLLPKEKLSEYTSTVKNLGSTCKQKGITYLANISDPTFEEENYGSVILQAVRRYITPEVVWRTDFDWRKETYEEYNRRTGWNKYLLRCVFSSIDTVIKQNSGFWGKHSVKYDVNF